MVLESFSIYLKDRQITVPVVPVGGVYRRAARSRGGKDTYSEVLGGWIVCISRYEASVTLLES